MFEDETVDIACPKCGHKNSILVSEFEQNAEAHFACAGCGVGLKIDGDEFRGRLEQVRKELDEIERDAKRKTKRPRKDDFQI